jgi:uncharacterized FlaG/YvyC family protein
MLGILGNLFDKEQLVKDTIQSTLENMAQELECSYKELFIMIMPKNEEFDFDCYIYKIIDANPKIIRKIPLKEILGDKKE